MYRPRNDDHLRDLPLAPPRGARPRSSTICIVTMPRFPDVGPVIWTSIQRVRPLTLLLLALLVGAPAPRPDAIGRGRRRDIAPGR